MNDFDLIPERGPGRRRAETLSRKVDLLLDTVMAENGQPFDYAAVRDAAQKSGLYVSREQWELLKAGKDQAFPEELLRALATVFGVSPEYLLQEDGTLSEREAELILLRSMRRAGVRNFHACPGGHIESATLREIARHLDDLA